MPSCVVPSCTSYTSRKIKAKDVKGWHCLPTDLTIRNKWIAAVRREPEDPEYPDDFRVCGLHFKARWVFQSSHVARINVSVAACIIFK